MVRTTSVSLAGQNYGELAHRIVRHRLVSLKMALKKPNKYGLF